MNPFSRRKFLKGSCVAAVTVALPSQLFSILNIHPMQNNPFDAIIIGGSYSGLAAGMALGRSLRNVLIIDGGQPCNRQTPHSHNFLTQDGKSPGEISTLARQQVERYETIQFLSDLVTHGIQTTNGFEIGTASGKIFHAKKLIIATGIRDLLPEIDGLAACWGISVLHCPYCHGYEVRNQATGILGNGDEGFEFAQLISHWTDDLTIFTNGKALFTPDQLTLLEKHSIRIVETPIEKLEHAEGYLQHICFTDGTIKPIKALYARVSFEQQISLHKSLNYELTDDGYIRVDPFQKTTVPHVFACGDNTTRMRTVSNAVATGALTGMMVNKELIFEEF